MAPGRVNVVVNVNETLTTIPFFTITPSGGNPINVELAPSDDLTYTGFFEIKETTPSGPERLSGSNPGPELHPQPRKKISIIRHHTLEVGDAMLKLTLFNEPFLRGGLGKIRFELENTGAAEIEIVTAQNSGTASGQADFFIMDTMDNVLSAASLKQVLGDKVITLANKQTVARIPVGASFISDPVEMFIPANALDQVVVSLAIAGIHYHLGQDDAVTMAGMTTRQQISLEDTAYYGEILTALPRVSKGDQDILITGRAIDRALGDPLAQVSLNLVLTVKGFERKIPVVTDETGTFTHTFTPLANEAGVYHVNAVHPDLLDRPEQGSFIINRVQVTPSKIQLGIPKNYAQKIGLMITTEQGTDLNNLTLVPKQTLPEGVHLDVEGPISIVAGGSTVTLNFSLWADVSLTLIDGAGNPAPDWVRFNTPADIDTLAVGDQREVSISFLPGTDIAQGMQVFYLSVTSSNYPVTHIGLYPTITSSGIGNALFKLSDIYTGTFNAKNELIRGLADGKITLQNEATLSTHSANTDSLGQALFQDLTAGPFKCRITATAHQEYTGRVWIKPGITMAKEAFLEYNLVTVEWEVNEITIEDKYEILLKATFENDVPAPVVLAEPLSLTLPDMKKGDVFLGEFTLINCGLIRADNLSIPVPESDQNFQYEILTGIPDSLEAKQRITIPYRITCLLSLDQDEEDQTGGGCYTYQKCLPKPDQMESLSLD